MCGTRTAQEHRARKKGREGEDAGQYTHHSGRTSVTVLMYGFVVSTNSLKMTHSGDESRPQLGCRPTTWLSFAVRYWFFSPSRCATCMKYPQTSALHTFVYRLRSSDDIIRSVDCVIAFIGYQRLKENVTNGKADNHEAIDFFKPVGKPDKTKTVWGENQWPTIPGFREKYEVWIEKMKKLGMIVMEA